MISSIIKSSSIKFIYENSRDNYWKLVAERINEHSHRCHDISERELVLEMKIPVPDIGIITQKYEIDKTMIREMIEWLLTIEDLSTDE